MIHAYWLIPATMFGAVVGYKAAMMAVGEDQGAKEN